MRPVVTIIICTFNRSHLLPETIPTVFNQNISPNYYRVIIVNNNSTDNTNKILLEFASKFDNLKIIDELNQGLSYSKNTGLNFASTEWLIFLDDDAKVPNNFIEKALININDSQYQCFGGVYLPWYKYGKPKWFHDRYASNSGKLSKFTTLKEDFISGGIMAIKKSTINKFGGFSTRLGMNGNHIAYGEETLLQIQMRKSGIKIGYDPTWEIYHLVSRYKLSPWWFIKASFASGRGAWLTYEEHVSLKNIFIYLLRSIKLFFVNIVKFTPKLINKNYMWQNWLIDILQPTFIKFGQIYSGIILSLK